jgi:REP element-mobilizing transposase RayT
VTIGAVVAHGAATIGCPGREAMMDPHDADRRPHARNLRAGRISSPFQTYGVTKCVAGRRPILADPRAAEEIINSLAFVRARGSIKLLAFVVMPDHFHAVLTLLPGADLSRLMRRIGSYSANRIRAHLGLADTVWQADGFYDRACRNEAEVIALAEYVHHNPVRKGWIDRAEDWAFSGAHPSRRPLLDWDWWLGWPQA